MGYTASRRSLPCLSAERYDPAYLPFRYHYPHMRCLPTHVLTVALLLCLAGDAPAQSSFDLVGSLELPEINTKKLKPALSDRWRLEGYALRFSNPFIGLGTDPAGRRVLVTRYPETDLPTGYYTITADAKKPEADGPAASLSPDGHSYRGDS